MPDFGIFRGFNEKLFGDKLVAGQLPTQLGLIGSESVEVVPTFEFSVKTDNSGASTSTQFKMPLTTSTGLDFDVDWGDGTVENITDHTLAIHDYGTAGTYTISVTGSFLGWSFLRAPGFPGDNQKILDIKQWSGFEVTNDGNFYGCTNLTASATDAPQISTSNLLAFFRECTNFNGAIGNWDMSGVTSLRLFLRDADAFDQDISNWDINQVTNFDDFMTAATGLSTTNYDLLLVGWEAQAPTSGRSINFGGSQYTLGSAAATARASLISTYGWTITDGGGV